MRVCARYQFISATANTSSPMLAEFVNSFVAYIINLLCEDIHVLWACGHAIFKIVSDHGLSDRYASNQARSAVRIPSHGLWS